MDKRPSPGVVAGVVLVLAISACSSSSDDARREQFEVDVREGIEALENEGWSQTPIVAGVCEFGDVETPQDRCLAFAAYLDAEGCPMEAFSSGFLFDVNDFADPLHPNAEEEWAEIGTRWDCSIDLAEFNSQAGALEESPDATALKRPTEASALEFVSDPANQSAFDERFSGLFTEPRVTIEARIDGACAAVRFHEGGEGELGGESEPWTGFLRWEEGEWHLQSVTLIPDAITLLSGFCLG